jgi:prepilin-type N-terminal cleavage/methylation domain-containing protein
MARAGNRGVSGARREGRRARRRGFTLIEILAALAILVILWTLAWVGYRRYLNHAKSAEAKEVIGMIRLGQENYRSEWLTYLNVSGSLAIYYPNTTPNDRKMNWNGTNPPVPAFVNPTNGWALLGVSTDGPVVCGYATTAGVGGAPDPLTTGAGAWTTPPPTWPAQPDGVPWYVIQAKRGHNAPNPLYSMYGYAGLGTAVLNYQLFMQDEQN